MPSRLTRTSDIRAVFAARNVAHGRALSVYARQRADGGQGRAAVIAGKRVGGAVQRNRAKRRLRALVRAGGPPSGLDLVLVAAAPAVVAPFPDLTAEYDRLRGQAVVRAAARSGPRVDAPPEAAADGPDTPPRAAEVRS